MARSCSICGHAKRKAINTAIAEGTPFRTITARYGVSSGAITRHKANCLGAALAAAQVSIARTEVAAVEVVDLLSEVGGTIGDARGIIAKVLTVLEAVAGDDPAAKAKVKDLPASWKDPKTLAQLMGALGRFLELKGKVTGEIASGPTLTVVYESEPVKALGEMYLTPACDELAEYLPADVVAVAQGDLSRRLDAQRQAAVALLPRKGGG